MKKAQFIIIMLACISGTEIWGQEQTNRTLERGQPSRYILGKEEQMLLPVNVLGLVKKPGQYLVPFRTNLISVIAYAGGFSENAKVNEIKIVRSAISLGSGSKASNGGKIKRATVLKVDIKKYIERGDLSQIPQLMPDDTIVVSGTAAQTVNKVFDFVAKATILAQLAFYVAIIADRR